MKARLRPMLLQSVFRLATPTMRDFEKVAYTTITTKQFRPMPRRKLPDFHSPSTRDRRALYAACHDPFIRATILEVIRLRSLLDQMDDYCETIMKAWSEEKLGTLVAMEHLNILRQQERSRMGNVSTRKPKE
jgi:hypothetical protein